MGSRILTWLSLRGRGPAKAPPQGNPTVPSPDINDADKDEHGADDAYDVPLSSLALPFDVWHIIIDILTGQGTDQRHLMPLTRVCRDVGFVAEQALYHRVSVGPRLPQLRSFLVAICKSEHRAAAVRTLRVRVPGVVFTSSRATVLQRLSGQATSASASSHYSVDASEVGDLQELIVQAFERLVNLTELDFDDLKTLPVACASSAFQLTELKTTGEAMALAISHLQTRMNDDADGCRQSPSALVSVEKLTLDLFHSWLQPSDLRFLSITHLFLDRARFVSPDDLQHGLPTLPNLLSVRVVWSAHHIPKSVSALWPTRILGDKPVRSLRRLELYERRIPGDFTVPRCSQTQPVNRESNLNTDVAGHLTRIRDTCPSITTLVWWPSGYHCGLSKSQRQFREALRQYTEGVFAVWPTLQRFERLKMEGDPPDDGYRAFVRKEDGTESISDESAKYNEEMWRLV